jgi:hypothetical protein
VPGGNHADVGFRLASGESVEEHARQPFILLDAEPSRFQNTLLHETGHMAMAIVAGGRLLDGKQMASIPHSTAALSDRTTAFTEGYAIHLETLQAHLGRDAGVRQRYHHGLVLFGDGPYQASEYFRGAADLTSYSQSVARYQEVRENHFSFESAFQGSDYLRVQLEKARDFSTVRDANQLLQSEGFYASYFFLLVMRGSAPLQENVVDERERQILVSMHAMFDAAKTDTSTPWLLDLAVEHMKCFPQEKSAVIDALNDLSHGVFIDPAAPALWKQFYLAALRLDVGALNINGINAARKKWREQAAADPRVFYSRLGPEVACSVPGTTVHIPAFRRDFPVRFDLNTVQPGILRLIPGITEEEISAWLSQRSAKPFADAEDFRARGFLRSAISGALKF